MLAGWSYFLWRALGAFGPASDINDIDFNSDSAIPVLMVNDPRPITVFNFYYYCADRWGAWAFLLMQIAGRIAGYRWTAGSVFAAQATWLFIGALVFARLSRRDALVGGLVYLIALCLHRESRYQIFELSQVYSWQTRRYFWPGGACGGFYEHRLESAQDERRWRSRRWLAAALVFSFLAIWSSSASILFLALFLCVETIRARSRSRRTAGRRVLTTSLTALLAVMAAALIEGFQKSNVQAFFHEALRQRLCHPLSIRCRTSRGQPPRAAGTPWQAFLVAVVCGCHAGADRVRGRVRLRSDWEASPASCPSADALADDTVIAALGACGIALLNVALAVAVSHVRVNNYDDRYLTLTYLFGPISGMLTIFLLLKAAVRAQYARYVQPAFVVVALALLASRFPRPAYSAQYHLLESTALALAEKAPRAVLMGDYWDTYVFTALQGDAAMVPVPLQGTFTRTPWTRNAARRAKQVIVAFRRRPRWRQCRPHRRCGNLAGGSGWSTRTGTITKGTRLPCMPGAVEGEKFSPGRPSPFLSSCTAVSGSGISFDATRGCGAAHSGRPTRGCRVRSVSCR